ncbi:MAG: pseudouridine synthase [Buchananella hordeovulneris]|nr:pseudouridine synthase [Buchananella hordeovulneris]
MPGTLAQWFTAHIPQLAPAQVARAFAAGDVVDAWGTALSGQEPATVLEWPVYLYRPLPDETELPYIPVVARGDGWLVVNKPKGLATIPRGSYVARSVTVALRRQEGNADLVPAHRLDRATSGLLLFTERPELRRAYQELFAAQRVRKTYMAAALTLPGPCAAPPGSPHAHGPDVPPTNTAAATHPLPARFAAADGLAVRAAGWEGGWLRLESYLEKANLRASSTTDRAANAVTFARPSGEHLTVCGQVFPLYEVRPATGKTHQIRAHFAALGAPLVGDPLYGGFNAAPYGLDQVPPGATALQLEAVGLEFLDPQTGRAVSLHL